MLPFKLKKFRNISFINLISILTTSIILIHRKTKFTIYFQKGIGEPHGAGNRSNVSIDKLWQEETENNFKKVKSDESAGVGLPNMAKNREEKVDKMRAQKDLELEDYRREIDRAKRFEKSKLLNQQKEQQ